MSDGRKTVFIRNGDKIFSSITGAGCMCTSLIGTFCAVCGNYLKAASAGILTLCLAGEKAIENFMGTEFGSGSFRTFLIDSVFNLQKKTLRKEEKLMFHYKTDYSLYLVTDSAMLHGITLEEAVEQAVVGGLRLFS